MIDLLQAIANHSGIFADPAEAAIRRLLTFDDRAALQQRLQTLAPFDRAIVDLLPEAGSTRIAQSSVHDQAVAECRLYFNALGRLHIRPSADHMVDYGMRDTTPIGFLALDPKLVAEARKRADVWISNEMRQRESLEHVLVDAQRTGTLSRLLADVADSVQHVEAVSFYIDDALYAVVERVNNLISTRRGAGLLDALRCASVEEWRSSDRLAVIALRSLFLSGGPIRFEEFNGTELSATRLLERLSSLGSRYSVALNRHFHTPAHPFELGSAVGELAQKIGPDVGVRYRQVNGLTFHKEENLISRDKLDCVRDRCAAAFRNIRRRNIAYDGDDARSYFAEAADQAITATLRATASSNDIAEGSATTPLECLLEEVVSSAVASTGADYGMSSSLRKVGHLLVDDPGLFLERIADLTTKEFYCCIVATTGLVNRYGARLSGDVFRAVQARMQYNRWHFVPGNLPRESVPEGRHYFYPPVMPDIAEWVDQYHAGHARARVRYSIRAPGPEIIQPPLIISGHKFRGFYDIRVVRVEGEPFAMEDMLIARTHCLWMGEIWRKILSRCGDLDVREKLQVRGFVNGCGGTVDDFQYAEAV